MNIQTEHPHIVRNPQVCGGAPAIAGTRITVLQIAIMWKGGDSVDEILQAFPHLQASQVHDAISYYLDHQRDMDQEIEESRVEKTAQQHGLRLDEKGFLRP
jgi:uncharacterized protein (DUF433 family)